ncbi:hypothetical protein F5Y07DRAFT_355359 [Xylaria sp. FL0933]|nr:hypothetical protein F5Y07DRAFT_355359 [Xylaria sp. FL0933]
MAKDPSLHEADLDFRTEVIEKLLASVGWPQHLKDSLGQFLHVATADANHKHLAYHLFCIATLYISKQTTLDEEQQSVICRTVGQLRRDWGGGDVPSENPPSHGETGNSKQAAVSDTITNGHFEQNGSAGHAIEPHAEAEGTVAFTGKDLATGDVNEGCPALHSPSIARSATPDSFVRGGEKCILEGPNFHGAVSSDDGTDLKSQYPFGFRLMSKQGWGQQNGLGPDGSGIPRPLDANTVRHTYGIHESPVGLGYEGQTNGKKTILKEEKPPGSYGDKAKAWKSYVADPRTGDEEARSDSKCDTAEVTRHEMVPKKGDTKIILQNDNIITDTWKRSSDSPRASQTQKNAQPEVPEQADYNWFVSSTDRFEGW